jgi:biopolymer transport protein ExbB/TolQ
MTVATETWPDVAFAFIPTVPGLLAAYYAYRATKALKTGNDKSVGEMVTEVHGVSSEEATPFRTHGPV